LDNAINLPADTLASLLRYLHDNDISTSEPLESRNGLLVETYDGRRVMIKRYVDGECHDVLPLDALRPAGAVLAKVHSLTAPKWLPNGTRRLTGFADQLTQFADQDFAEWVKARLEETSGMLDLPGLQVIIHGDYFADNLIVKPYGDVGILDWETASIDLPVLDLGFAIVGLACVDAELDTERMKAFLDGYQTVRSLAEAETAHLRDAVIYGAAVLGYHRYLRHHIRYPNPAKQDIYRAMPAFVESVRRNW
jgi:homoserine kinase type II